MTLARKAAIAGRLMKLRLPPKTIRRIIEKYESRPMRITKESIRAVCDAVAKRKK